jgi:hypothetical protein
MYPEVCPADPIETAEVFVMKRMDSVDAAVHEEHLTRCQSCAQVVETTQAFVQGMRDALLEISDDDDDEQAKLS